MKSATNSGTQLRAEGNMSTDTSRGERALQNLRPVRVFHPMLLALIPLCGLYAQNAELLPVNALARSGAVLVGCALALWVVFSVLRRNRYHGGLLASALIVPLFVVWGVLEDTIRAVIPLYGTQSRAMFYVLFAAGILALIGLVGYRFRKDPRALRAAMLTASIAAVGGLLIATFLLAPIFGRRAAWLITVYLMASAGVVTLVWKFPGDLQVATRSLNWFALILLALYGAVLIVNRAPAPVIAPRALTIAASTQATPAAELPDIYVIALDGYARSDTLRSAYAYNNLPFEQEMRGLGFQFVEHCVANYPQAVLSLAATLNMDYLANLLPESEREQAGMRHVFALYHENRLFQVMRDHGYQILSFSPGLESLEPRSESVQRLAPEQALGEFEMVLFDRTFASRVMQAYYFLRYKNPAYWRYDFRRERILYAFDEMGRLAQQGAPSPRVIFANLLLPEPPYLFTRDGGMAQPFGPGSLPVDKSFRGMESEYQAAYLDQLHFTNKKIAETARKIVETSKRPAVVLVMSSRGAPPTLERQSGATEERFSNLLAVRFPTPSEAPDTAFYDTVSLVNVFRLTLNRVLGAQLPLLADETYVSAEDHPFVAQQAKP